MGSYYYSQRIVCKVARLAIACESPEGRADAERHPRQRATGSDALLATEP
jgi:hypothetical protein